MRVCIFYLSSQSLPLQRVLSWWLYLTDKGMSHSNTGHFISEKSQSHTHTKKKQDRIFSDSFFCISSHSTGYFSLPSCTHTKGIPIGKDGVRWAVSMAAATYIHTFIAALSPEWTSMNEKKQVNGGEWMNRKATVDREVKEPYQSRWPREWGTPATTARLQLGGFPSLCAEQYIWKWSGQICVLRSC